MLSTTMRKILFVLCWMFTITYSTSCDENTNPPDVEDQEFSVEENSPAGTIIGVVIAYDIDEGQSVKFEIIDGNEDSTFEIDTLGGHLSVANPMKLDYELNTRIIFTVLVTDDHPKDPMESTATITVNLIDLNEFAPVIEDQVFEINENPLVGDQVGIIQASDPEEHQALSYTILSGNEAQVFVLDSETGSLTVNDPSAFDFEINQQFILTVLVRDIHLNSKTDTATITVNVADVQE